MRNFTLPKTLVFILYLLCWSAHSANAQGVTNLPKIGEEAGSTLSVAKEQMIGDQIMSQIRRSEFLVTDPLISEYIQLLGHRLVAANPDALGRNFQFFVVQDETINAFALPGGYIGINSGLITASKSESELASVLGHEVAHVTQRHLARRLERQGELTLPTILGLIGSAILASQGSEAGVAGLAATQAAAQQAIINHTRENEKEADRIGIAMLSSAGFDVSAAADFFETLQLASRYTKKPPEILLTHPLSRNRIAEARTRAELYPQISHQNSLDYRLIKARILSKLNNGDTFKDLQKKAHKNSLSTVEEEYQYAEMLKFKNEHTTAISFLNKLYRQYPDNQILLFSLAESYIELNNAQEILPLLLKQLEKTPGSTKLIIATAQAYLDVKDFTKAEQLLLRYADVHKYNPSYLYVLAQAQSSAGHFPEMHETTGQYLLLLGDLRTAKKHFELALNSESNDPYAQTRILARLDDVRKKILDAELQKSGRRP